MKRIFDLIFSIAGLILLSPVFLIISLLIKLDSKGPVKEDRRKKGCKTLKEICYNKIF